jgi:hypothetical protein
MPQIIVAADRGAAFGDGAVTFRETVSVADFESQHFATQLVERLGWAVEDADQAERALTVEGADQVERVPTVEDADQVERVPTSPGDIAGGREPQPTEESETERAPELQPDERVIVRSPA